MGREIPDRARLAGMSRQEFDQLMRDAEQYVRDHPEETEPGRRRPPQTMSEHALWQEYDQEIERRKEVNAELNRRLQNAEQMIRAFEERIDQLERNSSLEARVQFLEDALDRCASAACPRCSREILAYKGLL